MFCRCAMKSAASLFMVAFLLPAVLGVYEKEINFFKFGQDVGDKQLNKGDEAGALLSLKGAEFVFYDKKYTRLVVYDNGYLGVGSTTGGLTPFPFPLTAVAPMIAAYWADTDTTTTGTVYYRETQDSVYLDAVNSEIREVYGGTFAATSMVIVTWDQVGYCCNSAAAQNNSYQAILATDGSASYVFLRYWDIQWTTGDRSGGSGGRGGSHAVAGVNAGDGQRYISIQGSAMEDVENINTRSNIGKPGVYVFRTDPSIVSPGPFMMFPFGGSNGDTTLATGDDANSGLISLSTNVVVYDRTVKDVIVSENGYISADGQLQATTPTAFPYQDDHPVIAPFWADAARSSSQGAVYYRETTDSTLLAQAEYYILLSNGGSFSPTSLFIVTWDGVGHEPDDFTETNTFQAVIATDASEGISYLIFLYDSITWTASAVAGVNEGNGKNSFSLPGSGTSQLADLDVTSNAGIPGVYVLSTGRASLYPYGRSMSDRTLGMVDDHSLFVQLRRSSFPFYGTNHNNLRVYSNGYISLSGTYGGFCPNANSLKQANISPLIAPFFADADVSSSYYLYNPGGIYFRETSDICLLDRAAAEVNVLAGDTSFRPTGLVIATWDHVGYSKMKTDKLNTFQVVMATDGTTSHILFLYGTIAWTASDPCGGVDGIGGDGNSAQVGVTAGDGVRFFSLPTSGLADVILIDMFTNCGIPGLYLIPTNTETPAIVSSYKETAYVDNTDLVSELANEKKVYRYQDNGPSYGAKEPDRSFQTNINNIDWDNVLKPQHHNEEENGQYDGMVNRGNVVQVQNDNVQRERYENYQNRKYNYDRYRYPVRQG